jgi:hypothetical protein
MPLPWVRLDTAFPFNHKILAMIQEKDGHRSAFVYICGLAMCGSQGTDGFISRESLAFVHGRAADAERLVSFALWVPQPGGWLIPDWAQFQQTNEETQLRSKRAAALAEMRWSGHTAQSDAERARSYRARKKGQPDEEG